jgi:rare lipoprotein A
MKRIFIFSRWLTVLATAMLLASCAEFQFLTHTAKTVGTEQGQKIPGRYKIGKPYQIKGAWYYPKVDYAYDETGIASWYGSQFHGRKTANGERFDMNAVSAAHRTLPLPSYVSVINLNNGRSLKLRVNDRGPFARGRILDLSRRAAQLLGMEKAGTARVRVTILPDESRALAAQMASQTQLASLGSPITVSSMPKASVSSQPLAPPPGSEVAPAPVTAVDTVPVKPAAVERRVMSPELGVVQVQPVSATRLFVQAGAYSRFDNANRVRAALSPLGQVKVTSVLIRGRDLYRVRVGPVSDVKEADRVLESVIQSGYPDARILVD